MKTLTQSRSACRRAYDLTQDCPQQEPGPSSTPGGTDFAIGVGQSSVGASRGFGRGSEPGPRASRMHPARRSSCRGTAARPATWRMPASRVAPRC